MQAEICPTNNFTVKKIKTTSKKLAHSSIGIKQHRIKFQD